MTVTGISMTSATSPPQSGQVRGSVVFEVVLSRRRLVSRRWAFAALARIFRLIRSTPHYFESSFSQNLVDIRRTPPFGLDHLALRVVSRLQRITLAPRSLLEIRRGDFVPNLIEGDARVVSGSESEPDEIRQRISERR
jgi:hypothetical protein